MADSSGNRSYGSTTPRKASNKSSTGGKKAKGKKSGSPTSKKPQHQY